MNKLIPIRSSDTIYYAYPKQLLSKDMKKYLDSFIMEKEIYSANRRLRGRTEKVDEIKLLVSKNVLLIPRFLGECFAKKYDIAIRRCEIDYNAPNFERKIDFTKDPRPGQNEVYLAIIGHLETIGGVTLKLNTGCGKTWIISKLIWNYWKHSIVFVSNIDQRNQVCAEIAKLIPGLQTYKMGTGSSKVDKQTFEKFINGGWDYDYPFICVSVSKTATNQYSMYGSKVWDKFYISFYDECQTYCSDTGSDLLKCCQTPMKVALSATPDLPWNSNLILLWCGPLFDGDALMPGRNIKGSVKIINYHGMRGYSESQRDDHGNNSYANTLRLIEQDTFRINMGMAEIASLHNEGLNPIVFFQHLDYMHNVATLYNQKYGTDVGILEGGTPEGVRNEVKEKSEVVFTTYKFGSTGLNIPRVKSMVLMEPHKTRGKQVNGRPLRDDSDTVRKYVDIVDVTSFLGGQLSARMEDYRARNFEIESILVRAPDPKKN